jgi:hypothetical protein
MDKIFHRKHNEEWYLKSGPGECMAKMVSYAITNTFFLKNKMVTDLTLA